MKKFPQFQRVVRQCKYLLKRLKAAKNSLSQHLFEKKLQKFISKHQSNNYIKRLVFGLIIGSFPLNEMNGQILDFNRGIERPIFNNYDSRSSLNLIDFDNDGDFDFLYNIITGYGVYNELEQVSNKWNNNSPIFINEEINSNSPVEKSNIYKLFYKSPNSELKLTHLDLNGDSLESLVIIGEEYLNKNFITVYKQNIENDSIKFDTIPFFHLETNLASDIIDINRDGNIDLINKLGNSIKIYLNQGDNANPIFDDLNPTEISISNHFISSDLLDYDHDGDYDLEFTSKDYVSIDIHGYKYYNTYGGFIVNETVGNNIIFSKIDTLAVLNFTRFGGGDYRSIFLKLFDLDMDGDLDLIKKNFGDEGGLNGLYANYTWIENETPNSNFVVKGKIKNSDGEAIFTPMVIEPEGIIRWPNYGIDTIDNQYISEFNFGLDIGTHKIYPRMPEDGWISTPEYIDITAIENIDSIYEQDFTIQCLPGQEDYKINALTVNVARPGFQHYQIAHIDNVSDKFKELSIKWTPDPRLEILSNDETLDSIRNGIHYFTVDINGLESAILNNEVKVPASIPLGDTLKSHFEVKPNQDINPSNNFFQLEEVVVGSWDPNDKIVSPKGAGEKGITDIGNKEFTYTIRFQNNGNFETNHVVITDTIDSDFDMKTFRVLGLPNEYEYNIGNYTENYIVEIEGNYVRFYLPIKLPPQSVDDLKSQGYVQYSVKLKEGIQPGEIIKNKADIYFDFNTPITTNETINELAIISKITQQGLPKISSKIYPNPTNSQALLEWDKTMSEEMVLSVYDINGKLVMSKLANGGFVAINVENWANGIYLYVLESSKGNAWGKLMVE